MKINKEMLKMKAILISRSVVTNLPKNGTDEDDEDAYEYDTLCANLTVATSFREDPYVCNKYITLFWAINHLANPY
jgi:hypothetical protein